MSRLPREAASRNMSACSAQAMSHVGWRLMVASSAKINRPRAPAACGDIALARATNAAMSSEADGLASGSEPSLPVSDALSADFGLVGSPDIKARFIATSAMVLTAAGCECQKGPLSPCPMWAAIPSSSMQGVGVFRQPHRERAAFLSVVGKRCEGCNRSGIGHSRRCRRRLGWRRPQRTFILEELVEHALDRGLGLIRSGIAHVVVLE